MAWLYYKQTQNKIWKHDLSEIMVAKNACLATQDSGVEIAKQQKETRVLSHYGIPAYMWLVNYYSLKVWSLCSDKPNFVYCYF